MSAITDILRTELERLARALHPRGIPLVVGGGYGLLLRQEQVLHSGARTVREIPKARATNDLDLFLSVEVVTDAERMGDLRDVLHASGYTAIVGAEHYQFEKAVEYRGTRRAVKVDLLAAPPRDPALLARVKVDARRIRHRKTGKIHAHVTPEAFLVEEEATPLELGGTPAIQVFIPHPYPFLLLKLHAYRDRRSDRAQDFGIYHAFDLYRIVAMMTESEYGAAEALRDQFADDEIVTEARRIVAELFGNLDSPGAIAILEHARVVGAGIPDEALDGFLEDLRTFFPDGAGR